MKKIIFLLIIMIPVLLLLFINCSDMNDKHDIYLSEGEDIYIGKIDSLVVLPGDERVLLRLWDKDPRAKTASIYWYPLDDSVTVTLNPRPDSTEVLIGGATSNKIVQEGSYTFNFITHDNLGNHSVPLEKMIKVYGARYRLSLINRGLKEAIFNQTNSSLSLSFATAISENDIGVEVKYMDSANKEQNVFFRNGQITGQLKIQEVDLSKEITYRTLFLPEPLAIDTFYTESQIIEKK